MAYAQWNIDASHSNLQFSVRHMVITKVRGAFRRYEGTLELDDDGGLGKVDVRIDAASIDTGVADRDAHLRGPDFFDAERHPEITFRFSRIEGEPPKEEGDRFRVIGDLTIRDGAMEVTGKGGRAAGQRSHGDERRDDALQCLPVPLDRQFPVHRRLPSSTG